MSLTTGFISSLLSKEKKRVYSINDPDYKPPQLQVVSLRVNPNILRIQELYRANGVDNVPVVSTHGIQWMTVSDGNYSISATLNPDLKYLVDQGTLKTNSVFELNGYFVQENIDEAHTGRELLLQVGHITFAFPKFPERI